MQREQLSRGNELDLYDTRQRRENNLAGEKLIYSDKMRAEGPNHYPYTLGLVLNEYKIKSVI